MSAAAHVNASNVAIAVQQEDALYSVVPSAWYLQRGVEWPLQGLQFDVTGAHGQARRLDLAVVAEKVESFGHAPPSEPYGVTLWPCDEAGMLLSIYCYLVTHTLPSVSREPALCPVGAAWCARPAGHPGAVGGRGSGGPAPLARGGQGGRAVCRHSGGAPPSGCRGGAVPAADGVEGAGVRVPSAPRQLAASWAKGGAGPPYCRRRGGSGLPAAGQGLFSSSRGGGWPTPCLLHRPTS